MEKEKICDWCGEKVDEERGYHISDTYKKILCHHCTWNTIIDNFLSDVCCTYSNPEEITSITEVINEDNSVTKYKMTITKVV